MPEQFWIEEYRKKAAAPSPWVQSGRSSRFTLEHFLYVQKGAIELLDLRHEHDLLDVGCANGLFDIVLSASCRNLLALEPVEQLAAIARNNLAGCPNARVEVGHGAAIPADDHSFDRVLMLGVIQLVPPSELWEVFRELRRVTRPSGRILLASIPNARHRDEFLDGYLEGVRSATHLSSLQKTQTIRRNLHTYWYDPGDLAARLSHLGQARVHSLPATAPESDHRFHLTVSLDK